MRRAAVAEERMSRTTVAMVGYPEERDVRLAVAARRRDGQDAAWWETTAHAAWLLLQHADSAYQEAMMPVVQAAARR
jgi:hypothetical protein